MEGLSNITHIIIIKLSTTFYSCRPSIIWSIFWLASSPQFTVALIVDQSMTETRLDEPVDVRLKTNVTPDLLSLKMCPSESADVNCRVTLSSEDEGSKSILHSKRVNEPCFSTSHENVWGYPTQICTALSCIDEADNMQADEIRISCMKFKLASTTHIYYFYLAILTWKC